MELTEKRQKVKDDLEKMKLEGLEAMTRKQVDDMETSLAQAEQKHEETKVTHENLSRTVLDLQAGIEHLCSKLNEIHIQGSKESIQTITSENLVEGLGEAQLKMMLLQRSMQQDKILYQEAESKIFSHQTGSQRPAKNQYKDTYGLQKRHDGPQVDTNVRVKVPEEDLYRKRRDRSHSDGENVAEEQEHQAAMRRTRQRFQ